MRPQLAPGLAFGLILRTLALASPASAQKMLRVP